jgi:arylsulfatase A-like enzyme
MRPHVLLVSIDTLRVDHVSCYGYERPTTPHLDRLAADGARFEWAFGTAVWTPPAHASMLTGLYPSQHGVVDENRLVSSIPTIAEMLAAVGYRTLGVANNSQVGALIGLDRGHQSFHEVWRGVKSRNVVERGLRFLGRRLTDYLGRADHGAAKSNGIVLEWLESQARSGQPLYMFVHYIEPHNPLKAPAAYRRFADRRARIDRAKLAAVADNPLICLTDELQLTPVELEYLIGLYDEEICYIDSRLGEVLDALREAGLYEDTLILVTADHGEHFGEHGLYSHVASLYEPIVHIPLIAKLPGGRTGPAVRDDLVQHVDLLPTIAEAVGVEPPQGALLQGRSLAAPPAAGQEREFVYAEWEGRVPFYVRKRLADKPPSALERYRQPISMIRDARYKYLLREDGPPELYDLASDPAEEHNLAQAPPAAARSLPEQLAQWKAGVSQQAPQRDRYTIDPEIRKHLESLGYM